jgi:hypothetical protein
VLTLTVAPNPAGPRTGTVTVGSAVLTVTQAGTCTFDVKPERFRNVDEDRQTGLQVNVATTAGCTWTATSQASWITITAGASGSGNGVVVFSVAENDGNNRKGTLLVAGRTVEVEQQDD